LEKNIFVQSLKKFDAWLQQRMMFSLAVTACNSAHAKNGSNSSRIKAVKSEFVQLHDAVVVAPEVQRRKSGSEMSR
jgi:hypothetical protein